MDRHALERITVSHPSGDLTFMAIVNDNTRKAAKLEIGGWWGRVKTTDLQPFILLPNGSLDFGATPDGNIEDHTTFRFADTNLHQIRLVKGELVWLKIWDEEDRLVEGQYPITAIHEILGSGPSALVQV